MQVEGNLKNIFSFPKWTKTFVKRFPVDTKYFSGKVIVLDIWVEQRLENRIDLKLAELYPIYITWQKTETVTELHHIIF